MAEEVVRYLKQSGYRAAHRNLGRCSLISAQKDDRVYLISIGRGSMTDVYVAKIVAPELLPNIEWDCDVIEYSPYGYYVLEEDIGRLLAEITKKIELVDRVYRSSI